MGEDFLRGFIMIAVWGAMWGSATLVAFVVHEAMPDSWLKRILFSRKCIITGKNPARFG